MTRADANDIRRAQAAARDLAIARRALDLNAAGQWPAGWPAQWLTLAAARLGSPLANWRELADGMRRQGAGGMTKDKATAGFRRLRRALDTLP